MGALTNPLLIGVQALKNLQAPALGNTIAMPSSAPALSAPIGPLVTKAPTQTDTDTTELSRLKNTGSGVDQVQNPLLRGISRAGDIAASVFAPNLAQYLPGTTLHHERLVGQQEEKIKQDETQEDTAAQITQRQALAQQEQSKAAALLDPHKAVDPSKTVQTDDGVFQLNPETGKYDVRVGDRIDKPKTIEQQAYDYAVQNGKNPLDAYASVYGAKNTKTDNLPQQYLEAIESGNTTKADLIKKVINDTQTQPKIEIKNSGGAGGGLPSSAPGQVSPLVQAIIDGRSPAPNSRSKAGMALMAQVTAADPTYDASRYNTYQAAQKEITSGKTGQNINALNTLINHINDARQHLPDNGSFSPLNAIENTGGSLLGKNPTGKFDTDAIGIGGEFGKLVSGGVATVDEQKHLQKLLDHNASPKTLRDNLDEIEQLAHGKLEGIYKQVQSSAHPGPGSNIPSSLPASSGGAVEYERVNGKLVPKVAK